MGSVREIGVGGWHGVPVALSGAYREKDYRLELVRRAGGPVSAYDPFCFRVMECPGMLGHSSGCGGTQVTYPPPVVWYRGHLQGIRGKRPGRLNSTWELPPSPPHRDP